MKLPLQILSWITIILGALALIYSVSPWDVEGILGGGFFFADGVVALLYISEVNKKVGKK